ncbi:MAG: hypothetical protein Q8920_04900 [Bacillota bacterium]|nr:hypothetical protein [Bacillota bacterium]
MYLLSELISGNKLINVISIKNSISFSCPESLKVEQIYSNSSTGEPSVESTLKHSIPVIGQFSNYTSLEGKFSFDYPSIFEIDTKNFVGSDILYHVDFSNKAIGAHGFVQVWKLDEPLAQFLEKSKSVSAQNIQDLTVKPIALKDMPGYLWDYSTTAGDNVRYKAEEVFFDKNGRMYRISYFVPLIYWNKTQSDTFWKIVDSLKVYN